MTLEVMSTPDVLRLLFGAAAAELAPWLWGCLGLAVGAGTAVAVMRRHLRQQRPRHLRSGTRGFPRYPRE
ncbi:hypothetical protein GCM10022205_21050 [Spinactinospora alkalitolerans]